MKALVLGASGLTGSLLVEKLVLDDRYSEIVIVGRTSSGQQHSKIREFLGDLFELRQFEDLFKVDHVFCCIGTTRKKTPDQTIYRSIDVGIPVLAAEISKRNGVKVFSVISAIGADAKSRFSYNRMKGEMERGVLDQQLERTYIFRPSIIDGPRRERRFGERFALTLFRALRFLLIGKLSKYRAIEAGTIAEGMIRMANSELPTQILESDQIA